MSLLYRLPLFHFDHEDPAMLEQHREVILEAIKLSSASFYNELEKKPFANLDNKLRIKLRKYLLRGRFRPTPFGKFAGVGLGKWGTELDLSFPLQAEEIDPTSRINSSTLTESVKTPLNSKYRLIPGIHKKLGYYHALVFDFKNKHWKGCKLPVNSVFETLIEYASKQPIDFNAFQQLLNPEGATSDSEHAIILWQQILETGFLTPDDGIKSQNSGKDMVVNNHLEIPETTRLQLQQFIDSAGALFTKEESTYIRDFKNWFTTHFDDRYLKLQTLLSQSDFLSGQFLQPNNFKNNDIAPRLLGNQTQHSLDLQEFFPKKELNKEIHDIQLLFRLDSLGNPVLENMVCNRPFVYTGRFNRDPAIEGHSQTIKNQIYIDKEVIYAHLALKESDSKQHIFNVRNIFEYEITPFVPKAKNQLGFDELYIGISNNQIQLFHTASRKKVIPVVMHPLNGEQITHPILRLLWEIAHQERFRFMPYQSETLSNAPFCPQLNWGKICLQSRRWRLARENFPDIHELQKKLDDMYIPQHILVGHADRELLLNRFNKEDLQILWQELQRSQTLTLCDPSWHPSGIFRSADGTAAYPQLVFQYSRSKQIPKSAGEFNPIAEAQENCLCLTLTLCDSDLPEVLECLFSHLEKPEVSRLAPCWFFLNYSKNGASEIRLRLLDIAAADKNVLLASFSDLFCQEALDWKAVSYFPESSKYGVKDLKISHRLFHLESKFLASKTRGNLHMNCSSSEKESLIIRMWTSLFTQSPNYMQLFEELKNDVKTMPSNQVCIYKAAFNYVSKVEKECFPKTLYLNKFHSHEYFNTKGESGILFLLNHLHMMINRFFPLQTQHHERRIRYRLYRELGKQIYSNPRATTASRPKAEFISSN
ncbi:lantibiotic dehydratase [uncultured Algoriphagus sp.]|uniref:lantibiotic dehydratase n=1 Tax=uncultured Algoriphagus sp. TaxID=417365 RepID=UPI0030EEB148